MSKGCWSKCSRALLIVGRSLLMICRAFSIESRALLTNDATNCRLCQNAAGADAQGPGYARGGA